MSGRKTYGPLAGVLGAAAGAALAWATLIEPYAIQTVRVELSLPRLPEAFDGFTILQISDLHMRHMGRRERVLRKILARMETPDLVAFTGDLVHTQRGIAHYLELCQAIAAKEKILAVFGNSEHKNGVRPQAFAAQLVEAGITPLLNRHMVFERDGEKLYLAGVDDPVSNHDDLDLALAGVPDAAPKIVLMHTPDSVALACAKGVDLVLSGHTHGGQVKLPVFGPVFTHSYLGRDMAHGLYQGKHLKRIIGFRPGRTQLYVTRGIGISGLALRFLCRPELTLLTLRCG